MTFELAGPVFSSSPNALHFGCTYLGTGELNVNFEDVDVLALQVETLTAP